MPDNLAITAAPPLGQQIDLANDIGAAMIAVFFAKSGARLFSLALDAAMGAAIFKEATIDGGRLAYLAAFGDSEEQLRRASVLMQYAQNWAGTQAFIKGRPVEWSANIRETLRCYLKSFLHPSPNDYCIQFHQSGGFSVTVLEIRRSGEINLGGAPQPTQQVMTLPCRRSSCYRWRATRLGPSLKSQMIADAIDYEFQWCPRFDPDRFEEPEQV